MPPPLDLQAFSESREHARNLHPLNPELIKYAFALGVSLCVYS